MKKAVILIMVLAIAVSPLFRGLFFYYETSVFMTILALLSFFYFMIKLSNREPLYFNKWLLLFGVLLVAAYSLAFINAVNIRQNITALLQVTGYLMVSIVLYDYYHNKKEQLAFAIMLPAVLSGFVNAVIGIEAITGAFRVLNDTLNNTRVGGTFQYSNTASLYYATCIIFSLTLMYALDKPFCRVLLTGINSTLLLAMLLTRSRGGIIVGFTAFLFLFIAQARGSKLKTAGSFLCAIIPALLLMQKISALTASRDAAGLTNLLAISFGGAALLALVYEGVLAVISRINNSIEAPAAVKRIISAILIMGAIVVVFVFRHRLLDLIPQSIIERFAHIGLNDSNISIRIQYDKDALKLIPQHWLLGVGGGGWAVLYYSVQDYFYISRAVHNHYFEVFLEAGILAFLSFTCTMVLSIFYAIYGRIKSMGEKHKIYLAGLLSASLALAVHSSFDFDFSFVSLSLLFWAIAVAAAVFLPEKTVNEITIKKHLVSTKRALILFLLVICSSVLLSLNGLYAVAAYNAETGLDLKTAKSYSSARAHYEEAYRLDPLNSNYTFELTKLYNYFADTANNPKDMNYWRNAARAVAERSIDLNPYLPENNLLLSRIYLNLNMPLEAADLAEKLIRYQPCSINNYELLAKAYIECSKYYMENNNIQKASELLLKCIEINPSPYTEESEALADYKKEALSLIKKD